MLVRVEAPHFVAGIVLRDGVVVEAAPILRWCVGWTRQRLKIEFARRGWRAYVVVEEG